MPLAVGVASYKQDLRSAWIKARDAGKKENTNSDQIISDLATDIANATQKYMETAQVITTHIINPGQSAPSANPIAIGPGTVSSPGSGSGPNGTLKFPSNTLLKSQIESAIKAARENGKNGNSDAVIATLALQISTAIHSFALTGIVETDIQIVPGAAVVGYLGPPPASIPVPGITGPGSGKGVGSLS